MGGIIIYIFEMARVVNKRGYCLYHGNKISILNQLGCFLKPSAHIRTEISTRKTYGWIQGRVGTTANFPVNGDFVFFVVFI